MGGITLCLDAPLAAVVCQAVDIDSCSSVGKDSPSFSPEPATTSDLTRGTPRSLAGGGGGITPSSLYTSQDSPSLQGTSDNKYSTRGTPRSLPGGGWGVLPPLFTLRS